MSALTLDLISPEDAGTLDGLFRARVARTPDATAYREYNPTSGQWEATTWAMAADTVARWQAALAGEGLEPGDRVAVMVPSGRTWIAFEQAALGLGFVVVPIFSRDRPGNAAYQLAHSGARLVLASSMEQWQAIAAEDEGLDAVRRVVTMQPLPAGVRDVRLRSLQGWLPDKGSGLRATRDGQALATLVYTSGTSGRPKGIMLSHRNILFDTAAGIGNIAVYREDEFLSFLPLNHMLERTVGYYVPMMAGASVAFVREIATIADDLQIIRPTGIVAVPRVYERVHEKINEVLAKQPASARAAARLAARIGWRRFEHAQGRASWGPDLLLWPMLDRLVSAKVRDAFGGRLRSAISGGAALPADVGRFLIGHGVPVFQGYGLTESSPVISVNTEGNNDPSSVGPALPGVELSIAADGEILTRGPHVMMGYWRDAAATAQAVDGDGWLHTGDTGRIEGGRLYIEGRIKDLIVLDTGEKVAPADMERAIAADPAIGQVVVAGEGRPFLAAIVVPAAGAAAGEDALLAAVEARCKDFPGYARIRRVIVAEEPWTLENDLMTATLKLKRSKIIEHFKDRLDALYESHERMP